MHFDSAPVHIHRMNNTGYQTICKYGTWKIASNASAEREQVQCVNRHMQTEESFVLLEGECVLFSLGSGETPAGVESIRMEKHCVYTIPRGVWHAHIMNENSRLLIVENAETDEHNSQSARMSPFLWQRMERAAEGMA